jgi:hypothetical protein
MHRVTVIIPNWNRRTCLETVLASLDRQTHPIQEIVVVDNGSTDGSQAAAERAGARVLRFERNLGFSAAVNAGLREARTPLVAVVNNDVDLEADYMEQLSRALDAEDAWFATGKLLDAVQTSSLEGTFDTICRGGCSWRAGNGRRDTPEWNAPLRIRLVPFTAALFRRELFERVGFLDERFESYLEDVDLGLRCAKEGHHGVYAPQAVARHAGSATLGSWHAETVRRISRNQVLLVAKHFPKRWFWRYGWPVLVAQGLWGLLALRHGRGWAYLRGKLEGLQGYRSMRTSARGGALAAVLEESEREIFRLQQRTGFDWYWRVYFALT